ncbi:MAG TPA: hypothetical protein VN228_07210 [Pyrinomonadaceae bacterium]|nr:hypothetical protein [Pyrinomonadaceae bacterium]
MSFLSLTLLYADPGAGALIWQLALAAFVGGLFYFRKVRDWVRIKFGGSPDSVTTTETTTEENETKR